MDSCKSHDEKCYCSTMQKITAIFAEEQKTPEQAIQILSNIISSIVVFDGIKSASLEFDNVKLEITQKPRLNS